MPSWLCMPDSMLGKSHVRTNETDPLDDEADLIQANHSMSVCIFRTEENRVLFHILAPVGAMSIIDPGDLSLEVNGNELPMGGAMDGSGTAPLVDSKDLN